MPFLTCYFTPDSPDNLGRWGEGLELEKRIKMISDRRRVPELIDYYKFPQNWSAFYLA